MAFTARSVSSVDEFRELLDVEIVAAFIHNFAGVCSKLDCSKQFPHSHSLGVGRPTGSRHQDIASCLKCLLFNFHFHMAIMLAN